MKFHFADRVKALRNRLRKEKLDALILMTDEGNNRNPYYLTGFGGTTGVVAISKRSVVLAVDGRYSLRARREARGVTVVDTPKGKRLPHQGSYVLAACSALGLARKARVGFEAARVPVAHARSWESTLKKKLVPTEGLVERQRGVKDAAEIRALTKAARITSEVFVEVEKQMRAGMRERDVAFLIDVGLRAHGATGNSFSTIVASGPNSAVPHHETGGRKLKAGEPVVLDFGGIFDGGYCSDLTRTVFVRGKKPHPKLADAYRTVLGANKRALRALKAGLTWKEYDAVARSYIEERGYGKHFTHGLGHSLGLEAHDPYDYARDAFQAGVVITNEPGIYIEGTGGIRIEDDVLVTTRGAKRLTNAPYLSV